jgi:cell division septation protein DedD
MTREQKREDGRKAFMVLALLILGGLVFAAGIMVGQRLVQCPEKGLADPLKQIDTISSRPPVDSRALSFPEALNGPRPKPLRRPDVAPAAAPNENTNEGTAPSQSADQKQKSQPTDNGEKPSNTAGRFCMQVAAYHERAQAQALLERLLKRGYSDVRVVKGTTSEKGVVYRVRVGHFVSREDAERQKEKIVREGNLSVLIVTEE